jgi:predicted metalloprotease with PDZ domain
VFCVAGTVLLGLCLAASAAAAAPAAYTLRPNLAGGTLRAVTVTLALDADPSGRTQIDLPDHSAGQKDMERALGHLTVEGGTITPGAAHNILLIRSAPGATLRIAYDIAQDWTGVPGQDPSTYYRAVIQPGYFHLPGPTLFAYPHGGEKRAATFRTEGFPKGWNFASTLERDALTVLDLRRSISVGGDFRIVRRGLLRVAIRGRLPFADSAIAAHIARIADSERHFWGDADAPYLVTVLPLDTDGLTSSTGGTAEAGGFALYLSPNSDDVHIAYGFAHERMHGWIPFQLGNLEKDSSLEEAWLTEGFTDYFARRALLGSRVWPLDAAIFDLNAQLHDYDASPVRTLPNARIARDFFSDDAIERLPYWRGWLLATLWDRELHTKGVTDGMDRVVHEMRDMAKAHPRRNPTANLAAAMRAHGIDITNDLARFVRRGEAIWLPADVFAPCGTLRTIDIPDFAYGFDAAKTASAHGLVSGVDPVGNAYAAGLRDGMQIMARLSTPSTDSRVRRIYRVRDRGRDRVISYLPAGSGHVRVQSLELGSLAGKTACRRVLAGSS